MPWPMIFWPETKPPRQNYRKFLTLGGGVYPIDALKIAGIDMSTPDAVRKTYAVLGDMVERLAELTS